MAACILAVGSLVQTSLHCFNKVTLYQAWLVLGWVTIVGRVYHLSM